MKNLILNRITAITFSVCIIILIGCSNSSTIFRYDEDTEYDSLFVQRDVGAEVFIIMNNGEEYTGELLRVRDSTILLCKYYEASEEDLVDFVYPFYLLQNYNIKMIELMGENHLIAGIIFGGLGGAALGGLIGLGINRDRSKFLDLGEMDTGCCLGGAIGMGIGTLIGSSNSISDEIVYEYANAEEYDFTQLNIYSRYGGKEPDYLKKIK